MNHLPVLPILLPLFAGALLLLLERAARPLKRTLALAAVLAQIGLALQLAVAADSGEIAIYQLGNWPSQIGIVLMLDRLGAIMLLVTATLGVAALLYASAGWDRRTPYFHALFQFQLMGLNGAFLTGDLFNLFVFFEVLLISSYGLLLHGGGANRVRRALHYVSFNLAGSALFLIAVGLIYGLTGTLNMADLARAIALAPAGDAPLIAAAGLLLLLVFCVKAALLPLYFWLPSSYAAASAPVAALFALMTKVGVYAVLRVYTLLFGAEAGTLADLAWPWLLPAGLATLVLGAFGALAARTLRRLIAYLIVASAGTLFVAVGYASVAAIAAALYYLVHSSLAAALLFLIADLVRRYRSDAGDSLARPDRIQHRAPLALAFMLAAVAIAALPPLSGFLAKLMLLGAIAPEGSGAWIWTLILASGLLVMVALARAGAHLFWREPIDASEARPIALPSAFERAPIALLLLTLIGLTLFAAPAYRYAEAAAQQLLSPDRYISRVLGSEPLALPERPR
jgi:multicomponent K+:H+ antiporter subunit D